MDINDLVYGHAQAKRVLQVLLKRSQERHYKKCVLGEEAVPDALKCLLVGESGTGKTHLIQSLRKLNDFPYLSLDATQLMPAGNSDGVNAKNVHKLISDKVVECIASGKYFTREGVLNQMVIFVDEFDKMGASFESTGRWNQQVQANFLTLIDSKDEFAGISWIFAGAFCDLYKPKARSIGFFKQDEASAAREITDTDILRAGIIPELLGRISLIVQLDTFTEDDYKLVLIERLLPNFPSLSLSKEDIEDIIGKAMTSKQGIRSLTRQLEMRAIDEEYKNEDAGATVHRS